MKGVMDKLSVKPFTGHVSYEKVIEWKTDGFQVRVII